MLYLSAKCYGSLIWWENPPYERRFGQPFKGPIIPFGSLVEYYPISAKDQPRIHQFGKKVLPGLFLGYALFAGGIWKDDVLVADLETLEKMDASEIYSTRLNAKEVIFHKENGKFIFPIADWRVKFVGGDQELRTSTLVRRPIQGEDEGDFLGESEGSLPPPQDSFPDACEAINRSIEHLGGRRRSAKGRRRDLTRSCLGSSGFSLCMYCSFRDMVWNWRGSHDP